MASEPGNSGQKSPVEQNIESIKKTQVLTKVRSASKQYERHFQLQEDGLSFGYNDSHKRDKIRWVKNMVFRPGQDMSRVFITDIQEVRDGAKTDVFANANLPVSDEQCFSVVIGDKYKTLDLVAPSKEVQDRWVRALKHMVKKLKEADMFTQQKVWRMEQFQIADKNKSNALCLAEVVGLLRDLNIKVGQESVKPMFDMFKNCSSDGAGNKDKEETLNAEEFLEFYAMITSREEISDLFDRYNDEGKYLDRDELWRFFKEEQKQDLSEKQIMELINELEPCPLIKAKKMMSIDGFSAMFVISPFLNIFQSAHGELYQDMTRPLGHYFIDSSHNTYLTGNQLYSDSSVEAYITAMKRGCRCVELDCWDGDEEPIIYHGYTLTSKIPFKDVISAVNQYAFETTDYPFILSLENHCSEEQQKLMAKYMKEILGDKLLTKQLPDSCTALPSPEDLKGKIIVKAKRLPEKSKEDADDDDGFVSEEDEAAEVEGDEAQQEEMKKLREDQKKEKKKKIAKELSDCVVICQSVHFNGFDYAKENYNFKMMSSYGENKAVKLAAEQTKDWIHHNMVQMSRTYPAGLRTDSSNYDPTPMWICGAQIVALNYQTPDENMHIYKGMFLDNGGCGYVLKPAFMRTSDSKFTGTAPYDASMKKLLKIKVISGYQLPKKKGDKQKSILDPYVKVDMVGVPEDRKTVETNHVDNNGFHPVWGETFDFEVNVPDLALLYVQVMDHGSLGADALVAQYCLPFNSLQQGYRTVHLSSKRGEPIIGAQLLLQISIK